MKKIDHTAIRVGNVMALQLTRYEATGGRNGRCWRLEVSRPKATDVVFAGNEVSLDDLETLRSFTDKAIDMVRTDGGRFPNAGRRDESLVLSVEGIAEAGE